MSGIATAVVGSAIIGGYVASEAAGEAAEAQVTSAGMGISEERRQFDEVQELLAPYVEAGEGAVGAQEALIGLAGEGEQQAAIDALIASPQYQSMIDVGEEGILQSASATGGLRGGNVQEALMRFRPQVLSQLIESQFGKLGTVAGRGQASAAGVGAAAQTSGTNIANLLATQGQAQAGEALARGQAITGATDSISQLAMLKGMGLIKF